MKVVSILCKSLFAVAVLAAIVVVLKSLWNWLLPELFGLPEIGFAQAAGLFLLSKLLFSGPWMAHRHCKEERCCDNKRGGDLRERMRRKFSECVKTDEKDNEETKDS
ncbi:hypothetical protein FUAX_48750 (plasmid) [Fulvitalea axinellae]|uniref:Uncharacterized protein n=1 Tax=Fulvitalea axinellae TaxID=1182444 RepID=A0AAU9D8Z9_9BACT|nr:hypothetical protein FUAX_48750 [Fulvitalea axinellae]